MWQGQAFWVALFKLLFYSLFTLAKMDSQVFFSIRIFEFLKRLNLLYIFGNERLRCWFWFLGLLKSFLLLLHLNPLLKWVQKLLLRIWFFLGVLTPQLDSAVMRNWQAFVAVVSSQALSLLIFKYGLNFNFASSHFCQRFGCELNRECWLRLL